MAKPSLREQLLQSGVQTVHRIGFARAGVREITAAAGVPQGSFTNHFRSKEAFGLAVLERYLEDVTATMDATLGDRSLAPNDRLRTYFATVAERLADGNWRYGCLIGNLSLEASEHSEAIRDRLAGGMAYIEKRFAETIREAQDGSQSLESVPPEEIAAALMSAWQGAMLWMKVHRSGAPIRRFQKVTLAALMIDTI